MSIKLDQIRKTFGVPPTEVLKGISLEINAGEFVALTGRSGSGKSTLLYIISTLDEPTSGNLTLANEKMNQLNSHKLHLFRNEQMGFVFQFHYLLPELTALENVLMPARKNKKHHQCRDHALDLLNQFGLSNKKNSLPRQMSGGEQQRVAIARALVMQPQFLFADEPTGNLDSNNGEIVMNLLLKINKTQKTTIVMVTHDPDFANLASRQIYLSDGKIVNL